MSHLETSPRNSLVGYARRAGVVGVAVAVFAGMAAAPVMAAAAPNPAPAASIAAPAAPLPPKPVVPEPVKPTTRQLLPRGMPRGQQSFKTSIEQRQNVAKIVKAGRAMGLPPRAWVVAVATSLQESKLHNLGHLLHNDHDSVGLFQQRPSSGWGTPAQLTDPKYAARAFYHALTSVQGYDRLPLTVAAQKVQVSAFPLAYAKWEKMAADLVLNTYPV